MSRQDADDDQIGWLIHPTPTTALGDQQDSILPAIATALATTTQLLGKPHNAQLSGQIERSEI
jgi:hypothetical protein